MRKSIRSLAAALAAITAMSCMGVASYADKYNEYDYLDEYGKAEYEEIYASLLRITKGKGTDDDLGNIVSDGDTLVSVLSAKNISLLYDENSVITFGKDLSKLKPEHLSSPNFHLYACFTFYKSAFEGYTCKVDITKKNTVTAGELFELAGIPNDEKITGVTVFQENSRGEEFTKGQTQAYKVMIWGYKPLITDVKVSPVTKKGWVTGRSGAKYYYKNGVRVKNTWIKSKNGKYRYVDADGKMVTGWADVKRGKDGRFSWFDENGYWDGNTYPSKYSDEVRFGTYVSIKVSRNDIISEPLSGNYSSDSLVSKKKAASYINNTEYELEVPLAVAEQLRTGDKLVFKAGVARGEKVNGTYTYKLTIPHTSGLTASKIDSSAPYEQKVKDALLKRFDLFNSLLVLRNGRLKLDMMYEAYRLDTQVLFDDDEYFYLDDDAKMYLVNHDEKEITYGLFGGYNKLNEKTGKFAFRNNITEKTLLKLMKNKIAEHKADLEKSKNDDVDWYEWVGNMQSCWLDVTVTEIPELPEAEAPTAELYSEIIEDTTNILGLTFKAKNVTSESVTVEIIQDKDKVVGTKIEKLGYTAPYYIQQYVSGKWVALGINNLMAPSWSGTIFPVDISGTTLMKLDFSRLYGELKSGKYRIAKTFLNYSAKNGRNEEYLVDKIDEITCYIEFEVTDHKTQSGITPDAKEDKVIAVDEEATLSGSDSMNNIPELYSDYIVLSGGVYYANIENEPSWKGTKFNRTELSPGNIKIKESEHEPVDRWSISASVLPAGTKLWWSKEYPNTVILAEHDGRLIPYLKIVEG